MAEEVKTEITKEADKVTVAGVVNVAENAQAKIEADAAEAERAAAEEAKRIADAKGEEVAEEWLKKQFESIEQRMIERETSLKTWLEEKLGSFTKSLSSQAKEVKSETKGQTSEASQGENKGKSPETLPEKKSDGEGDRKEASERKTSRVRI
jgi:ABC-type nitrate/sulfonate/bicarbonate transport system substrate-binding protein